MEVWDILFKTNKKRTQEIKCLWLLAPDKMEKKGAQESGSFPRA